MYTTYQRIKEQLGNRHRARVYMKGTAVYEIGAGIESEAFVLTPSLLEEGQTVDLDVPRIYIWNFNDIKITTLITSLRIINSIKTRKTYYAS